MFDYEKAKELSRQLSLFCRLLYDYLRLSCGEMCTYEEEQQIVVLKHISGLASELQCIFIRDETEEDSE